MAGFYDLIKDFRRDELPNVIRELIMRGGHA